MSVELPEDYGAIGDGVNDDYNAIMSAINAVISSGGGTVLFRPAHQYVISAPIVIEDDNVFLVGGSGGALSNFHNDMLAASSTIKALNIGGPVVTFRAKTNPVNGHRLIGGGIHNLVLDCNGYAYGGLRLDSCVGMSFGRLMVTHVPYNFYGVALCVAPVGTLPVAGHNGATITEPRDTQDNSFTNLTVMNNRWSDSDSAGGMLWLGDNAAPAYGPAANISMNSFRRVFLTHRFGQAFRIDDADTNVMDQLLIYRLPGGTGPGICWVSGLDNSELYVRHNHFGFVNAGPGGHVKSMPSGHTKPPAANTIVRWSLGNGAANMASIPGVTAMVVA